MDQSNTSFAAQDLVGKAIFFEIGARLGIIDYLENNDKTTIPVLLKELNIEKYFLETYLNVLESIGLLVKQNSGSPDEIIYSKSSDYDKEKNKIGYVAWGMMSCGPLLENTEAFIKDFSNAVRKYPRCGKHVARTSKWMGFKDFYPHAEAAIIKLNPKKIIDLGSGTCGLLISLAKKLKGLVATGVDLSKEACEKAEAIIKQSNLEKQIEVVNSPIQELISNNQIFKNSDVIHAGFVFHDLLPDEEETLDEILMTINKIAPNASLVISDAIPFAQSKHERSFSSAFSFLHKFFMGRRLLSEEEWSEKLKKAGFNNVQIENLGISGGRLFIASIN